MTHHSKNSTAPVEGIALEYELTDLDVDRKLLDLRGRTLLVFTSTGCASCRWARQTLPWMGLPVERIAWIDAANNPGAVQRYEVFHLPALFAVKDGSFYDRLNCRLRADDLRLALDAAYSRPAEELP
ncbi:thioredoxin family protein [Pseudomonas sp. RL_15y_Pfl2_60]|uniref:thioredoxin family protein n=1 Tax=Pseudomonas sp. RL_15y_Pfl2_60 TaxID=3088709 RepID=UPI0030D7CB32